MSKIIFQEVLLFVTYLFVAFLCLPIFFIFLWLTDNATPVSQLFILPYILVGVGIILFNIYFGRWLFVVLKSLKA